MHHSSLPPVWKGCLSDLPWRILIPLYVTLGVTRVYLVGGSLGRGMQRENQQGFPLVLNLVWSLGILGLVLLHPWQQAEY